MSTHRHITVISIVAIGLALVAGCGTSGPTAASASLPPDAVTGFAIPQSGDKGGSDNPVRIGVVGASSAQFRVLDQAASAEGIHLQLQDFTDYTQLNPALADGELDLNQFQHIAYLAKYDVAEAKDLVPIGSTAIYPLGLYSSKYHTVAEIPDGVTVAVPDDQTNQARGLQLLASSGLIQLKPGTPTLFGEVSDIDQAASRVTVTAISADQTARSLDDPSIAAAVINNDYIADTGLSPDDAVVQDDPASDGAAPYINIWVSRAEDQSLPVLAEIVRLAHTEAWNQALQQNSDGTAVLVDEEPGRLQAVLADAEQQLRAA